MQPRMRRTFEIFGPSVSLRHRVALSLGIVRLILAPVILLSVYYLFQMGFIVDRIVGVDAPAATLAQQASIQMLEARRAERNYLLLQDPVDLQDNHNALLGVSSILAQIRKLQPEEQATIENAQGAVDLYRQQLADAVSHLSQPGQTPNERIEAVVRDYENDLNALVRHSSNQTRAKLVDALRAQAGSFDTQITSTLQASDPTLRQVADRLDASSRSVFNLTSALETRNWQRVQNDHENARALLHRAEWVLSIVSAFTILLSIWVSFVLPREVVQPLVKLKQAVDHAVWGNYQTELKLQGRGEVVELARSVQNLIAHLGATHEPV